LRLTSREREIFELLRKEPLISQEDLAHRLGISRSSAAVHISNLMKKGAILGKGYVFSEQANVVIMGSTYLSIEVDTSQHRIDIYQNGTAIELAQIFVELGIEPKVMTVLGNDDLGSQILMRMQQMDVDTSNIIRLSNRRTCRRIYADKHLRYEEGLSSEEVQKAFASQAWAVFNCEYLVVDPCYQSMIYQFINQKDEDQVPRLCTYGHPEKEQDIFDLTGHCSVIALGISDSILLDQCITGGLNFMKNDQQLLVVTDGLNRLIYINNGEIHDFPLLPGQAFACKPGIPRLLAGLVYGLSNHYPVRQAVRIGVGAASSSNE